MPLFDHEECIGEHRMKALKDLAKEWREFVPIMISDKSLGVDFKQDHLVLTLLKRSFAQDRSGGLRGLSHLS